MCVCGRGGGGGLQLVNALANKSLFYPVFVESPLSWQVFNVFFSFSCLCRVSAVTSLFSMFMSNFRCDCQLPLFSVFMSFLVFMLSSAVYLSFLFL